MSLDVVMIEGEPYLTLETVAECYRLQVSWVQEAYELDLFGSGRKRQQRVLIAARMLDRVAEVRRTQLQTGLDLVAVSLLLVATSKKGFRGGP